MQDRIEELARTTGLAVSLTFDPTADRDERWLVTVGFDASGVGLAPALAMFAALLDLNRDVDGSVA